jgi:tetratricopeptide (TPR) repeat protein
VAQPPSAQNPSASSGFGNELSGTVVGPVIQSGSIGGSVEVHYHGTVAERVVPHHLPAGTSHFAGRKPEIVVLNRSLESASAHAGAIRVLVLSGMGGIGKTTLAVHWGHFIADQFPDGQLYVNLRGFEPGATAMEPVEALHGLIAGLGIRPEDIPAGLDEQVNLYRTLLDGRKVFLLLDNAADANQVRPLLPGSPSCLTVVTSRNRLASLVANMGAQPVPVPALSQVESLDLLGRHLGHDLVAAQREAAERLVFLCSGLPLAISIVGARAKISGWPLESLVAGLEVERRRLQEMDLYDSQAASVSAVFSSSYSNLTADLARTFRLLALSPAGDTGENEAICLIGFPEPQALRLLRELCDHNLISESAPRRFAMHDLVRLYAADQARLHESDEARTLAVGRLLDFLLATVTAADRVISPYRNRIAINPPVSDLLEVEFPSGGTATAWLEVEHSFLVEAIRCAVEYGFNVHAWQLAWALGIYYDRRGFAADRVRTGLLALTAAIRLGDPMAEALIRTSLGSGYSRLGEFDMSVDELRRATSMLRDQDLERFEADALLALAIADEECDRYADAKVHLARALFLYRKHRDAFGEAHALENLGWCHGHLGDYLAIFRRIGDKDGEADSLDSIGYVHAQLGEHRRALARYQEALALWAAMGNRYDQADVLTRMGDSHAALGDHEAAAQAWTVALGIFEMLAQPDADVLRVKIATTHPPED